MEEISMVLSGEAGTGLKTIEGLFIDMLRQSGFYFYMSKEIMSRIRGGNNTTQFRISGKKVTSYVEKTDYVIVLNRNALYRLDDRMGDDTVIIGPAEFIDDEKKSAYKIKEVDFIGAAKKAGNPKYENTVILGFLSGMLNLDESIGEKLLTKKLSKKGEEVVEKNLEAFKSGVNLGTECGFDIRIPRDDALVKRPGISGTEALVIGSLAGGCNFITSYPMSPSTGILVGMANNANEYGVAVEQAEDEIAAINMVLGAWYAGARAMASTSGGGFALMTEGISMSGIGETPAVIQLAQRPGPGTGLPTRTEQGDLDLVIHAGHGEFPRIVLSPGSLEDGINLSQKAFNIADKHQVPVIILSDAHYVSQAYNLGEIDFSKMKNEYFVVESEEGYKRYLVTENGRSPRSVSGYGKGLVCVDSDEHDETGHITEDFSVRIEQQDKRMRKLDDYEDIEPELIGAKDYKTLVVGWGSTYGVLREVADRLGDKSLACLHYKQVYPVPKLSREMLEKAEKLILVEQNYSGQFGTLLKKEWGIKFDKKILKYNGMPFSLEEVEEELKKEVL